MKKETLDFIIQEGEGYKIEFKENIGGMDKDIVAFSNAEGGRIFLGIRDDKKVVGINITNRLRSEIYDIARNCDPSIHITLEEFKNILVVNVKEGGDKPYRCSSGFYLRAGPNSQKLTRNEILHFAIGAGKTKFDEQINSRFCFRDDFDKERLSRFLLKAGIKSRLGAEDSLLNLGVAHIQERQLYFTNAGILFFAKKPQRFFRDSYVTCARFKGRKGVDVIDRRDIYGDLVMITDECEKFVKRNIRLAYKIEGFKRKEIPEYPLEAIREGILNAIMHRDYFFRGSNITVYIYSNRIEITNPGGLPEGLKKEDFGKKSVRRNPLIADLFHRIGYVEKMGTGIRRMNKLMRECGLKKPRYRSDKFFDIVFIGPGEKTLGEEIDLSKYDVSERQGKAIEYAAKTGKITNKNYRELLRVSHTIAHRELSELVQKKIFVMHGKGRSVYYMLKSG